MKKLLMFIVAVMLLATFSDHPLLLPYKEQLFHKFSDTAQNASDIKEDQSMQIVARKLRALAAGLGKGQQTELENIATNKTMLLEFHQKYCVDAQFHPLFYGETMSKLCVIIQDQIPNLTK